MARIGVACYHLRTHADNLGRAVACISLAIRPVEFLEILRTLDRLDSPATPSSSTPATTAESGYRATPPLFHHKWTPWEGGIRVQTIIRWPGHIATGRVTPQVGITMDLSASLLAATGTAVPPDTKYEGINLFPILEGQAPVVERTLYWRTLAGGFQ